MITMAIIALVGVGVVVLATLYIHHRAAILCRAVGAALNEDVQDKLKRAKTLDTRLAQEVLAGADMDAAIDDFTKDRANIHALPTEKGWLWDSEHLGKWAKNQFAVRAAAIGRKAKFVTLAVLVSVVVAVGVTDAVVYTRLPATTSALSPYPPTRSSIVPPPVSVPGSAPGTTSPASTAP